MLFCLKGSYRITSSWLILLFKKIVETSSVYSFEFLRLIPCVPETQVLAFSSNWLCCAIGGNRNRQLDLIRYLLMERGK